MRREHELPLKSRGSTNTTALLGVFPPKAAQGLSHFKESPHSNSTGDRREKLVTKIQRFSTESSFLRFYCHSETASLIPQGCIKIIFVGNPYGKNNINIKHFPRQHNSPLPTESSWRFIRVTEPPEILFFHPSLFPAAHTSSLGHSRDSVHAQLRLCFVSQPWDKLPVHPLLAASSKT